MRTPAGYLQADAFLTRAGVFEYRDAYGKITRELRHPDDVFAKESLATLPGVPLTDLHPPFPVNSGNAAFVARGSIGDTITRDGDMVGARVCIIDDALLMRVEQGQRELSCGYYCDIELEAGTYNGEAYDVRQKNIRYDHVACVPKGRAGDEVRLRIDGAHSRTDAADGGHPNNEDSMKKIVVDGKEIEVSEVAALVVQGALEKRDADLKAAQKLATDTKAEADKEKGRADAAETALAQATKAHADAVDPAKLREQVKARLALEATATKLGVEKADELEDKAIKIACIKKIQPEHNLDGQSDASIDGIFGFISKAAEKSDALDKLKNALTPPHGEQKKDAAAEAQAAMVAEQAAAHNNFMKR